MNLLQLSKSRFQSTRAESDNPLGVGERYHVYLRSIYNKALSRNRNMQVKQTFLLAIKAITGTTSPSELLVTILVCEVMPCISIRQRQAPNYLIRMRAKKPLKKTGEETASLVARSRLAVTVMSNVFTAATSDIKLGDEI